VTKRDIQRAHPAGIRDPAQLAEVLKVYGRIYPGTVRTGRISGAHGPETQLVDAPRRTKLRAEVSPVATGEEK